MRGQDKDKPKESSNRFRDSDWQKETLAGSGIVTDIEPTYGFKDIAEYKDTLFKKVLYR